MDEDIINEILGGCIRSPRISIEEQKVLSLAYGMVRAGVEYIFVLRDRIVERIHVLDATAEELEMWYCVDPHTTLQDDDIFVSPDKYAPDYVIDDTSDYYGASLYDWYPNKK